MKFVSKSKGECKKRLSVKRFLWLRYMTKLMYGYSKK